MKEFRKTEKLIEEMHDEIADAISALRLICNSLAKASDAIRVAAEYVEEKAEHEKLDARDRIAQHGDSLS